MVNSLLSHVLNTAHTCLVYTTTYKKLKDPTACRLENFWWHVWGSDRRFLNGSALAKLYEEISVGPTFVPLKGPPNRWEGPDVRSSEAFGQKKPYPFQQLTPCRYPP